MPRQNSEASLVRAVGIWGLAASIVNITIGGGIYRLPAAAATALGPPAPLADIVCAVAMALIVLCFAEAGSRVALTGGVYAYVEVAFGPLLGFVTGVLMWAGMTVAMAAVSSLFGDALVAIVPALAPVRGLAIAVTLGALAVLNIAGVRGANQFVTLLTAAKLLPLLILVLGGVAAVHRENLVIAQVPPAAQLGRASIVSIFAFLGIETALVPGGEVRDPARTVPRAVLLGMLTVAVIYLAVQLVAQGILGPSLAGNKTPLADAAAIALGSWGRAVVLLGMTLSMFVYLGGMTLAVPRTLYAFARDGFLPSSLGAIHGRFRTPHVAIVVQTILALILAVSGTFERLVVISNGSVLLVYAACCPAVVQLRRTGVRGEGEPFRIPLAAVVPVLALLAIGWILSTLSAGEWEALMLIVAASVLIFAVTLPARRARRVTSVA